jgi:hypothetical protein
MAGVSSRRKKHGMNLALGSLSAHHHHLGGRRGTPVGFKSLMIAAALFASSTAQAGFFDDLIKGVKFNPAEIGLDSITYGGDGCPQGSLSAVLSPDASEITIFFDAFQTRVGADLTTARAACEVKLNIRKPKLWSYKIESVDFRGFVFLDRGVRAEQKVDFQNGPAMAGFNKSFGYQRFSGPINQNYTLSTIKPLNGPDLLSCLPAKKNVELKIRSSIELKGGGGAQGGMMTVDSVDGRVIQKYRLSWISCLKELGIR